MNPHLCLRLVAADILDAEWHSAADRLNDYQSWRRNGGAEPVFCDTGIRGDQYATQLARKIDAAIYAPEYLAPVCW